VVVLASIGSSVLRGVDGVPVTVEVHVAGGLPAFSVVGLPDASCREARDRVRAAILSSGLRWPQQRITVNLAPSGVPKAGAGLDLPMAIGVLVASGAVAADRVRDVAFLGELGLDGSVRPVSGTVPLVEAMDAPAVVVPPHCQAEAMVLGRHVVRAAPTLAAVVEALEGRAPWSPCPEARAPDAEGPAGAGDLADVRGQALARQAVEVAAAGGHHLLLAGPPGAGKTMLAQRLVGLLPPLDATVALEATKVHSAAGERLPSGGLMRRPPFRAPHHGASMAALVGGGSSWLRPGEISLAHGGVLFLDELAEFSPGVLDALRQPLEDGRIRVARAHGSVVFPARFLLVAASNPCPCGNAGSAQPCRCSDATRRRYRRRLSAPLLDRFDLRLGVSRPDPDQLTGVVAGESSSVVAERVQHAREVARCRGVAANRELVGSDLDRFAALRPSGRALLAEALRQQRLTARGVDRVRRVARTLADLSQQHERFVEDDHLALALHLRADPDALLGADS
jgi:magnesium chelatase family protein